MSCCDKCKRRAGMAQPAFDCADSNCPCHKTCTCAVPRECNECRNCCRTYKDGCGLPIPPRASDWKGQKTASETGDKDILEVLDDLRDVDIPSEDEIPPAEGSVGHASTVQHPPRASEECNCGRFHWDDSQHPQSEWEEEFDKWTSWKPSCGVEMCSDIPCYEEHFKTFIRSLLHSRDENLREIVAGLRKEDFNDSHEYNAALKDVLDALPDEGLDNSKPL